MIVRWLLSRFNWKLRSDAELLKQAATKWRYEGMNMMQPKGDRWPQGYVIYRDGMESRSMCLGHAYDFALMDNRTQSYLSAEIVHEKARVVIDRGDRKRG